MPSCIAVVEYGNAVKLGGDDVRILHATFGTQEVNIDVTEKICGMYEESKGGLWLAAWAQTFGDPAPWSRKSLRVEYEGKNVCTGETMTWSVFTSLARSTSIKGACFAGIVAGYGTSIMGPVGAVLAMGSPIGWAVTGGACLVSAGLAYQASKGTTVTTGDDAVDSEEEASDEEDSETPGEAGAWHHAVSMLAASTMMVPGAAGSAATAASVPSCLEDYGVDASSLVVAGCVGVLPPDAASGVAASITANLSAASGTAAADMYADYAAAIGGLDDMIEADGVVELLNAEGAMHLADVEGLIETTHLMTMPGLDTADTGTTFYGVMDDLVSAEAAMAAADAADMAGGWTSVAEVMGGWTSVEDVAASAANVADWLSWVA